MDHLVETAKEYIELMKKSGLGYFRIKNDKFEIELGEKHPPHFMPPPMGMPFPQNMPAPQNMQQPVPSQQQEPACAPGKIVRSPIIGTFYCAPSPEKPPYVNTGKQVNKGDVLFIIESMKLMNEVTSEFDGVVREIYVKDGDTVEYDQPIMRIE